MRRDNDKSFNDRYFIPVQGMLLEVSKNVYKEFYSDIERRKYLHKLDKKFELTSIDSVHNLCAIVTDNNVFDTVANKIAVDKLHQCLTVCSMSESLKNLEYQSYLKKRV